MWIHIRVWVCIWIPSSWTWKEQKSIGWTHRLLINLETSQWRKYLKMHPTLCFNLFIFIMWQILNWISGCSEFHCSPVHQRHCRCFVSPMQFVTFGWHVSPRFNTQLEAKHKQRLILLFTALLMPLSIYFSSYLRTGGKDIKIWTAAFHDPGVKVAESLFRAFNKAWLRSASRLLGRGWVVPSPDSPFSLSPFW